MSGSYLSPPHSGRGRAEDRARWTAPSETGRSDSERAGRREALPLPAPTSSGARARWPSR